MAYLDYNDLSGVSGGPVVIGDYTASVFLHDTSGFYNWQQDNLPLIDLHERDTFLFKMLGSPTSAVEGVSFVLSSTAGPASSNIFADISDITSRIPKRITYPILVEVCKYGSLSALNLNGITTEGDGALRIINRNCGMTPTAWTIYNSGSYGEYYGMKDKYTPSGSVNDDGWNTIIDARASSIGGGAGVASYVAADWQKYARGYFMKTPDNSMNGATDFVHLSLRDATLDAAVLFVSSTDHAVHVDYDAFRDLSISAYDPHPKTRSGRGDELFLASDDKDAGVSTRKSIQAGTGASNKTDWAIHYGGYFTEVLVESCAGNIILENIIVDGASGIAASLEHVTPEGFQIRSSSIKLKNCMSVRNSHAGFSLRNSTVDIQESICGARNYPAVSGLRYHSTTHDTFLNHDNVNESVGYGLKAINSYVNFDSASGLTRPGNYPKVFFANGVGVFALNSCLKGGSFDGYANQETEHIQAIYNNYDGFSLRDSSLTWNGGVDAALNGYNGVHMENSVMNSHIYAVEDNQRSGIYAKNSSVKYGLNNVKVARASDTLKRGQFSFNNNGQNLTLVEKSTFKPSLAEYHSDYKTSFLTAQFGEWTASSSHHGCPIEYSLGLAGAENSPHHEQYKYATLKGAVPGILVKENSTAEIFNLDYMSPALRHYSENNEEYAYLAIYGHAALARDNSQLILRGLNDSDQVTTITSDLYGTKSELVSSPTGSHAAHHLNATWNKAAVCAKGNSFLKVTGPTKVTRHGIGLLGEDNSIIEVTPPEYPFGDGTIIDAGNIDTSVVGTQTKLSVHSTRCCIVVNNNSTLKCEFLGSPGHKVGTTYVTQDPNAPFAGDVSGDRGYNICDEESTKHGYIAFYPHGFTDNIVAASNFIASDVSSIDNSNPDIGVHAGDAAFGNRSTGGMCVRAVGDSSVYLNEVSFKPTVAPATVSGPYYDLGAGTCERPHIWNIADTSRIHATRLYLSGLSGSSTTNNIHAYHGPSGCWSSPDTWLADSSSVSSIRQLYLDDFGVRGRIASGTNSNKHDASNWGYFRLMVGTANYLDAITTSANVDESDVMGQLIAQGYSPSTTHGQLYDAGAGSNLLDFITNVGTLDSAYDASQGGGGAISTTNTHGWIGAGMLQASSFTMHPGHLKNNYLDPTARNRNFMDEEAMRLFANAKQLAQPFIGQISPIRQGDHTSVLDSDERDSAVHSLGFNTGVGVRSLNRFDLRRLT